MSDTQRIVGLLEAQAVRQEKVIELLDDISTGVHCIYYDLGLTPDPELADIDMESIPTPPETH